MRAPCPVAVGDRPPVREIGPITQTDIVRFAGAGGDFNPLHHDPSFAAVAGFRSVIAMGQLQAGILAAYLSDWLGVEYLRDYEARFVAPVYPGDVLVLSGEVVSLADGFADIVLTASVGEQAVVTAQARAVIVTASATQAHASP
jgi:3-hydroxybutyryl-CoA dehydratase